MIRHLGRAPVPARRRLVAALATLAVALMLASAALASAGPAPEPPKEVRVIGTLQPQDLPVLQKVFGNSAVTILTDGGKGTMENVKIVDIVELFGKAYLHVKDGAAKPALIRADTIVAIRVD